MKSLISSEVMLMSKVMDMQLQRQNVIMSNIANVNTPEYMTREVKFEGELQKALGLDMNGRVSRTSEAHMPSVFNPNNFGAQLDKDMVIRVTHGEDRVNLDAEMTKMTKNNLHYNALSQTIKKSFDGIRTMIQEGSK